MVPPNPICGCEIHNLLIDILITDYRSPSYNSVKSDIQVCIRQILNVIHQIIPSRCPHTRGNSSNGTPNTLDSTRFLHYFLRRYIYDIFSPRCDGKEVFRSPKRTPSHSTYKSCILTNIFWAAFSSNERLCRRQSTTTDFGSFF